MKLSRTKVFISYSRSDSAIVHQLHTVLQKWRHHAWLDIHDIKPGDNWQEQTVTALAQADIVIAVITPHSISGSGFVRQEFQQALSLAQQKKCILIPLIFGRLQLPKEFSIYHAVDWNNTVGQHQLIHYLDAFRKERMHKRKVITIVLVAALMIALIAFFSLPKKEMKPTARFDAQIIDAITKKPIKGATVTAWRNKGESIKTSLPSDVYGNVHLDLDTVPEIRMHFTISCEGYPTYSSSYELKSKFHERPIYLKRQ